MVPRCIHVMMSRLDARWTKARARQAVANMLNGFASVGWDDDHLVEHLCKAALLRGKGAFTPPEVAMSLQALAVLYLPGCKLRSALPDTALRCAEPACPPCDMREPLTAKKKMLATPLADSPLVGFFVRAAALTSPDRWSPEEAANLAWACAVLGITDVSCGIAGCVLVHRCAYLAAPEPR